MEKLLFVLFLLSQTCSGFNVDLEKPIYVSAKRQVNETSLFGYSLVLTPNAVFVGTPGYDPEGAVFYCNFNGKDYSRGTRILPCTLMSGRVESADRNRDFFGATLAQVQGKLHACAPRTGAPNFRDFGNEMGTCYRYEPQRENNKWFPYFRLQNPDYYKGWRLFTIMGHSMITSEDSNLVLGAPIARGSGKAIFSILYFFCTFI